MPVASEDRSGPSAPPPSYFWAALVVACLGAIYLVLQIGFVRPYLWPAGHGIVVTGDPRFVGGSVTRGVLLARPPEVSDHPIAATVVYEVVPASPGAEQGLQQGDDIVELRDPKRAHTLDLTGLLMADAAQQVRVWREAYWMGLRGRIGLKAVRSSREDTIEKVVELDRRAVWRSDRSIAREWARQHLGVTAQLVVFIGAAIALLALRSADPTAALAVLALTLSGVGNGGPLMGSERILPAGLREILTIFSWTASPLAFPFAGLAVLYFPRKSPLLIRQPWLHAVPFVAAAPMIATSLFTGLFLAGVDRLQAAAVWDATHPAAYYGSFAVALAVNVLAIVEGIWRFKGLDDPNERRRIRIVVFTVVPGVLAYALKAGLAAVGLAVTGRYVELPSPLGALLQALILLPAFGLTYAVAVHRVFGPRVVMRRSLQYALATNTLTGLALLPAVALAVSLVRRRDMTLGTIFTGQPLFYVVTIGLLVLTIRYRDPARAWLDRRFFREEYDARQILLSLAGRVRFETDPDDLSAMVVQQIDTALHPKTVAILASGIDEGQLIPVSVLHGSAESLPLDGGLVTMLRWSDEPLEVYLSDVRSPARRLPREEHEWLECTGAVLLVPIMTQSGADRSLLGLIALGEKRSEEPYTAEDRQLLADIAAQMGLGFDVVRLRRRLSTADTPTGVSDLATEDAIGAPGLVECPQCGRCEEEGTGLCPTDGTAMAAVSTLPRVVDRKFRIDQLLGRGGMGAVYRARDVRLDRDVALKVVRAQLLHDPQARTRFRREAQIVARLQHPSVVSVFDYGTLPTGAAYLVMEYVRGDNLRRVLRRDGRMSPDQAVRLMSAVCAAIQAAHREGILHRDLKPENILMPPGDIAVKVLDFGIAKVLATAGDALDADALETLTVQSQILGTPAYMAPEQLRGGNVDARTDVFSLGVIAYEMLTGTLPFGSGSIVEIAARHAAGPPQPMHELAHSLEEAVRTALAVEPAARPPSPLAFAEALQAARES